MKPQSLIIERPLGKTLIKALLILGVVLITLEGAARTDMVRKRFRIASLGNYHFQFEMKWFQLQRYVEKNGGVDVIFLGSSLVNAGIMPSEINQAYVEQTGEQPIRIFNFGIEGMTIQPNSVVAELLVETYHPKMIIFGTEIRDYYAKNGITVAEKFLSDPWVRFQTGNFSLQGWLAEHSSAYRYYLAYRNWMNWEFYQDHSDTVLRTSRMEADGHEIETQSNTFHTLPPDPDNNEEDREAIEFFADFEIDPSRLENLQSILDLGKEQGVFILFIEMPVSPTFFDYFERGEIEHTHFIKTVSEVVTSSGNIFILAPSEDIFPEDGRPDRVHLNEIGAPIFSRYLGERLAELLIAEDITFAENGKGE